ncbi:hypothetical protein B0T24DRAFT_651343 [Lasiosphaeria ovina]|uniref:Uncharacterized protein n=1 Tax=Lasiosphaeria ovina TaxID=92902 RepID=A0AAE0JYV3_9PEZI|nr:hypothetical protein B0T24DRAFT_651343 [Lasiosphaeria ovina]
MLPTPDTSHVPYARVYEPAEDSFLLLDTLSSASETAFLSSRFGPSTSTSTSASTKTAPAPLVLEVGPGSGVVVAFLAAHARAIFGRADVLAAAVDVNRFACAATAATAAKAVSSVSSSSDLKSESGAGCFLDAVQGDLTAPLRAGVVDVLVFNPPYVPTEALPQPPPETSPDAEGETTFEEDSHLLALSYAGGRDGMETTERLLAALPLTLSAARGCAYVLLCAGNRPDDVKARVRAWDTDTDSAERPWRAETVGLSGKQAGWEKLQIVRIWRDLLVVVVVRMGVVN